MPEESRASRQGVVPMINYADGPAAMDWLTEAFGFVEVTRMVDDGMLSHGEMMAGDGLVMLATATRDYEGPKAHREHCPSAAKWQAVPYTIDGVLAYFPDIDAHCENARAKGATILSEPGDSPWGRQYRVEDIEGHRWMFLERPEA